MYITNSVSNLMFLCKLHLVSWVSELCVKISCLVVSLAFRTHYSK